MQRSDQSYVTQCVLNIHRLCFFTNITVCVWVSIAGSWGRVDQKLTKKQHKCLCQHKHTHTHLYPQNYFISTGRLTNPDIIRWESWDISALLVYVASAKWWILFNFPLFLWHNFSLHTSWLHLILYSSSFFVLLLLSIKISPTYCLCGWFAILSSSFTQSYRLNE